MSDLILQNVRKTFGSFVAVEGLDLQFGHGELTALLGPSGCGKTTLLRMIAGLEAPTKGRILFENEDITSKGAERRNFGMVFQSFALFPHMNVAENIAYSLTLKGVPRAEREARAKELLELVQLGHLGTRRIGELSGGQRQRVAIARALAQEPGVFLLDEPMSALDAQLRGDMQMELRMLQQKLGITTIVVTHDQREAMTMADKIVVMSSGRVEQIGTPQEIYHEPANAFVASFIGSANLLKGTFSDGAVKIGALRFEVPAEMRAAENAPVTLFCRPEKVRLGPESSGDNVIAADVKFVRDLGPVREIHLVTEHGPVAVEAGDMEGIPLKAGDRVNAHLPKAALRLLPGDAA
ncbi:ABC transporter ATP-binding protein [Roseovarius aquimarinus]|uniref:ABC transporter ATP-binding protein n=1 Tax=Roseovarius aquimarinus TaxID=1229156 RepID=A0ABW7I6A8_9RHOB